MNSAITTNLKEDIKFTKRCAIYARVSTDERLDQEFNSIDAQVEACRAFIQSQRSEGWIEAQPPYIDPGFSGGNLNRPALTQLLKAVAERKLDMIVFYKIDRLSRSLANFSNMVETLEAHDVSFSSVTQQINSSTSMGRLMLNILLSFAQFERENTAERIRDKIGAAKRKGMWMGGVPPLGYDVINKRLVVNAKEAELVRRIYDDFLHCGSTTTLCNTLSREGITAKSWITKEGKHHVGGPIDKKLLHQILRNRMYLGEISLKDDWFKGNHESIIDSDTWEHVQSINAISRNTRRRATSLANPSSKKALLRGILFDANGDPMYPSVTTPKSGVPHLYYKSRASVRFGASVHPRNNFPGDPIEQAVIAHIRHTLKDHVLILCVINEARKIHPAIEEDKIVQSLSNLNEAWEMLHFPEQYRLMQLLVKRVTLMHQEGQFGLDVEWHEVGWMELVREHSSRCFLNEKLAAMEAEVA
jgi:DNA invertase Pin-like site-specific DNA recombinase